MKLRPSSKLLERVALGEEVISPKRALPSPGSYALRWSQRPEFSGAQRGIHRSGRLQRSRSRDRDLFYEGPLFRKQMSPRSENTPRHARISMGDLWGQAYVTTCSRHLYRSSNLLLSIASIWEILIKVQLGKLNLPQPAGPYIIRKLAENRIEVLPITLDHVLELNRCRSIIVTVRPLAYRAEHRRRWPIITADPWFARYPVEVIW